MAILDCVRSVFWDREEVIAMMQQIGQETFQEDSENSPVSLRRRIEALDQRMVNHLEMAAQNGNSAFFEKQFRKLTQEKAELIEKLEAAEKQGQQEQAKTGEFSRLLEGIQGREAALEDFDDNFIRRIVEQVTVLSDGKIEVRFVGGMVKMGAVGRK